MSDARMLAEMMLEWEDVKVKLDEIESVIIQAVLKLKKTQTVGNVTAKYSGGRRTLDWEATANNAQVTNEAVLQRTRTQVVVDWKKVCQDIGVADKPVVTKQARPSVTVGLLEEN